MRTTQRLDKLLGNMGLGTRSEIRNAVKQGRVLVNGVKAKDSGAHVDPDRDVIEMDQERVLFRDSIYLMMNKPPGVISATEDNRERTVVDLLDERYARFKPFPAGRLDKDTEGLLLLTNDGQLAHNLLSPRKHVPKTYFAIVEGRVDERDVAGFRQGVELDDGYRTLPAELTVTSIEQREDGWLSRIELTIMEGKFHQVKRMFQAVGKKVVYLKRLSMGTLWLDDTLAPGECRELSETEIAALRGQAE